MKLFVLEDEIDKGRIGLKKLITELSIEATYAKSKDEGIQAYAGPYDLLLLDHDMEGRYELDPTYPNTGHEFVKWLVDQKADRVWPKPPVVIHSWNAVGARNMMNTLMDGGFNRVQKIPFGTEYLSALRNYLTYQSKVITEPTKPVPTW